MQMKSVLIPAVIVALSIFCSCGKSGEVTPKAGKSETISKLSDNIQAMGFPEDFDIVNDDLFVVTDRSLVYLYQMNGEQVRIIGQSGNAQGEYRSPSKVRAYKDSIYVWSSMTLKFLTYALDGTPGAEYTYSSAVSCFEPSDDRIFIYAVGRRGKNVIDVLDKQTLSVDGYVESSEIHQTLCSNSSVQPLFYDGQHLTFMAKDRLDIYRLDLSEKNAKTVGGLESDSFKINELPGDPRQMDRQQTSQYLKENPITLQVVPAGDKKYKVLTLEGHTDVIDDKVSNDNRYFGLYEYNGKNTKSNYFTIDSFGGYWHLISTHAGEFYFISHEIEGTDESYYLKRCGI